MRGGNSSTLKEGTLKKEKVDPLARGVGCLILGFLVFGGYFASGLLVNWLVGNPLPGVPDLRGYGQTFGPYAIPGANMSVPAIAINYVQLMLTLVIALLGYSILSIVYAIIRPPKRDPKDAPPVYRKIDKSKVR